MLNYIELENWKAHGNTKIHFSKGTNIFIGQMGAGKSSILDAISFALFGTFPSLKSRRLKMTSLIRNKPEQKNNSKITLSFSIDEVEYIVERSISLTDAAKAKLQKNGTYLQSQPERVTEEIEKALKIDYDLFSRAVYSEQNRLDYFLELGSSDRKKQIDNLLGIDKFATAQENAGTLSNKIKDIIIESEKLVKSFDITKLKVEIEVLNGEIKKLEDDLLSTSKEISDLVLSLNNSEKLLYDKKAALTKKLLIEKELAEIKSKLSVFEKDIKILQEKKIPPIKEIKDSLKEIEEKMNLLKKEQTEISETLQKLQVLNGRSEKELFDTEKGINEKLEITKKMHGKDLNSMRKKLELDSSILEELEKEHASFSAIKVEIERSISELKLAAAKCPICDNELSEDKKKEIITSKTILIEKTIENIQSLSKKKLAKKAEIKALSDEINNFLLLKEREKLFEGIEDRHSKLLLEKPILSEKIKKARENFIQINSKLAQESDALSRYRSLKENAERLISIESEKDKLTIALKSKQETAATMPITDKEIDELQKLHTKTSSLLSEKKVIESSSKQRYLDKKKQIMEKQAEISKIERIIEDNNMKKSSIDELSKFRNALQETQALLRQRLVSSINDVMQSIWPEIYPYGDYTGIELKVAESDYDLNLRVMKNNTYDWESVNAIASGGERSMACMALRIAFSLVLVPNLKWLILDEPTHNIDRQGLSKIVSLLNERLPNIIDQILIITHDEQLKQVSNGRIYSFTRNKEKNKETVIAEL